MARIGMGEDAQVEAANDAQANADEAAGKRRDLAGYHIAGEIEAAEEIAQLLITGFRLQVLHVAWLIDKQLKLGLDLKGGVHLVLRVKTDDALRTETELEMEREAIDHHARGVGGRPDREAQPGRDRPRPAQRGRQGAGGARRPRSQHHYLCGDGAHRPHFRHPLGGGQHRRVDPGDRALRAASARLASVSPGSRWRLASRSPSTA